MHRLLPLLLLLLLGQCLAGSTQSRPTWISDQPLQISSMPVPLASVDPARRTLGALRLLGAWHLTSDTRAFGGLSALDVERDGDADRITALSDSGFLVQFRFGRFGHASNARIVPLPPSCGKIVERTDNDTESLAHDAARQNWWVGYEWRNVICRLSKGFDRGIVTAPSPMARWGRRQGAESMLRLGDGRFLALAEGSAHDTGLNPLILFDGDPTAVKVRSIRLSYRAPEGFRPTDMAQLPDGRILVLNRRFALSSLFTAKLVLLDPAPLRAGTILKGRVIADFAPPVLADNFEGLAVTTENGRPVIWIVSDDNYMRWQRTLLLKFALN